MTSRDLHLEGLGQLVQVGGQAQVEFLWNKKQSDMSKQIKPHPKAIQTHLVGLRQLVQVGGQAQVDCSGTVSNQRCQATQRPSKRTRWASDSWCRWEGRPRVRCLSRSTNSCTVGYRRCLLTKGSTAGRPSWAIL